jgi:hypothetical protein
MAILDVLRPRRPGDPVILVVSASELNARAGQLRKEIELGAHIRVEDERAHRTVGWLTADPVNLARYLERQRTERETG